MTEPSYDDDIEIDEEALDIEWLNQPKRMLRYCRIAADMRRKADLASERLEMVKARLTLDVQSDPDKYGLAKTTQHAVESAVLSSEEYEKAYEDKLNAKYEAQVADGAVKAFEQRKNALENLVRLHGQSYFAGPSIPRDLTLERRKQHDTESANRKVGPIRRNR